MTSGPLSWLRVVDLTDTRGALCGRILGDLGADVVKLVRPSDDASFARLFRDANKRGFTDAGQLHELLAEADVLVENLDAEARAALDLDRHPHLVHVALADFGLSGPRAGWRLEPLTALAASGTLHASGFPALPPCAAPGHLAHDCASVYGAIGAVAAVLDRHRHGHGQLVEVSVQEAALAGTTPWSLVLEDYTRVNPFLPTAGTRNADGAYWVLPAADGWIRTVIGSPRQWEGFVKLLGEPDVLTEPEWRETGYRLMNADVIRIVAGEMLVDRTRQSLFDESLQLGTTVGVLHRPSEFVAHPQTASRGFFTTEHPGSEGLPFATFPVQLSATPAAVRHRAPRPDDGDASFAARPTMAPPAPLVGELLLDGIRVIEFGSAAVVPEMSGVLSELGAEVIRIESMAHPDVLRFAGSVGGQLNQAFAFNAENRGRKSVTLDLTTAEGRRLALDLCAGADIVAENQRGGVLDGLGLGYDDVRRVNPAVIYATSQGYGRGGPLGEMPAYGPLNSGFAGVHVLWNHPDAPYPCGTSLNHPDHIAGKLMSVAVLAALDHRQRTGEGQLVDMSQTEAAAYLIGELYLQGAADGADPEPAGNLSDAAVPHGLYPAAGDDRWLAVVAAGDDAWRRLAAAVGWPPDQALDTLAARLTGRVDIDARLAAWAAARPAEESAALLQQAGVSAMPVMGPVDHHADPHLTERGFIVTLEHPEVGPERHAGNPVRLSRLPQRTAASSPCLGADTTAVLRDHLGLTDDDLATLDAAGVLR